MENHRWIVQVLDDLATYARENKLGFLAEELRTTMVLAQLQMSEMEHSEFEPIAIEEGHAT